MARILTGAVLALLVLVSYSWAVDETVIVPPDPVGSSSSLTSLINEIKNVRGEVSALRQEVKEYKLQTDAKLSALFDRVLLAVVLINVSLFCFMRLAERIYLWLVWKKQKREISDAVKSAKLALESCSVELGAIQNGLNCVRSTVEEVRDKVSPVPPRRPTLWERFKGVF